jgi:hypothetical protein
MGYWDFVMNAVGNFLRSVAGMLTSPSVTFERVLAEKDVTQAAAVLFVIAGLEFLRIVLAQILIMYKYGYAEASAIFVLSHPLSVLILVGILLFTLPRLKGRLGYATAPEFEGLLVMAGFSSAPLLLLSLLKFALPGFGVRIENVYLPLFFELWYVYLLSLGLNVSLYGKGKGLKSIAIGVIFFLPAAVLSGLLAFFFLLASRDALALL